MLQAVAAENATAISAMLAPQANAKDRRAAGAIPTVIVRYPVRMPPADGWTDASARRRP